MRSPGRRPRRADRVRIVVVSRSRRVDRGAALDSSGHDILVLDKGRSPGGRMATRRIATAAFDHGAQFFTVHGDEFGAQVAAWETEGVAGGHGFTPDGDGYPRYIGTRGMNAIAEHMAVGLDVHCGALTFAIRRAVGVSHGWEVVVDDGTVHPADALVSTCPLAQTFSLLFEAGVDFPANWWPMTMTARSRSSRCSTARVPCLHQAASSSRRGSSRSLPTSGQGHQRRPGRHVARHAGLERTALGRRPHRGARSAARGRPPVVRHGPCRRQPSQALAVRDAAYAVARPVLDRTRGLAGRRRRRVRRTEDRGCLQLGAAAATALATALTARHVVRHHARHPLS